MKKGHTWTKYELICKSPASVESQVSEEGWVFSAQSHIGANGYNLEITLGASRVFTVIV